MADWTCVRMSRCEGMVGEYRTCDPYSKDTGLGVMGHCWLRLNLMKVRCVTSRMYSEVYVCIKYGDLDEISGYRYRN
jgi:hypothetical protein